MGTLKDRREAKQLAESIGLEVLGVGQRGTPHQTMTVKAPDGRTKKFVFACSGSNRNSNLAMARNLKHFRDGLL